jgi:subtilisin family serine protease
VSPASAPSAVTVGASNRSDALATFSNHGPCVDIHAPGRRLTVARMNGSTGNGGGTSGAAPHAGGAAALYLAANPAARPAEVAAVLMQHATGAIFTIEDEDQIGEPGVGPIPPNTTSLLLYTGGSAGLPAPPPPPAASFGYTCSGFTCAFTAAAQPTAVSYSWTFSGGATASGLTVSRTFAKNSTNTVTLTVRDADGRSSSTSKTVKCTGAACS